MEMNLGLKEVEQREAAHPWDSGVSGEDEPVELTVEDLKQIAAGSSVVVI